MLELCQELSTPYTNGAESSVMVRKLLIDCLLKYDDSAMVATLTDHSATGESCMCGKHLLLNLEGTLEKEAALGVPTMKMSLITISVYQRTFNVNFHPSWWIYVNSC